MPTIPFELEPQPPLPFQAAIDYGDAAIKLARVIPEGLGYTLDVPYGPHRKHRYDVYYPADAAGAPVVLFFHGGGWTHGYKEFCRFMAAGVTRLGAILVAPNYRLAPEDRMPAQIEDGLMLLSALADDATFTGDLGRVVLSGHSAGGHVATMTALHFKHRPDDRLRLAGCAPISGIMDLRSDDPVPGTLEARVYDAVLSDPVDDIAMSPIGWAAGNMLPFALHYGGRDSPRVIASNARLAALLRLQPCALSVHVEGDWDHFDTHLKLREGTTAWHRSIALMIERKSA